MSNLSIYVRLGADVLTEQEMFYGLKTGWGFKILMTLGTFLTGFCLAGLFRSVVVHPPELIWPGVLSTTSLATTLHHIGRSDQLYVLHSAGTESELISIRQHKHMENLSICLFQHRLLPVVLLVLVSRLHIPRSELFHLPVLDQSTKQSCESTVWNEDRHGLVASNLRL